MSPDTVEMRILYVQPFDTTLWIVRLFEDHKTSELHLSARFAHCTCIDHCAQYLKQAEACSPTPIEPCAHIQWMYRRLCKPDVSWSEQYRQVEQTLQLHCAPDKDTDCAICLESVDPEQTSVSNMHCKHWFHESCMNQWLRHTAHRGNCPCCRAPWTTNAPIRVIDATHQCFEC